MRTTMASSRRRRSAVHPAVLGSAGIWFCFAGSTYTSRTMPRVPDSVRAEFDLPYAGTDNPRQRLDLFLPKSPKSDKPLPVVAFIHGGGWQTGDKRGGAGLVVPLVETGEYAGVSIGYRLTGETIWPAQIHDCKAAIGWLAECPKVPISILIILAWQALRPAGIWLPCLVPAAMSRLWKEH